MVKKQNTMYLSHDKMTSKRLDLPLLVSKKKKMNKRPLKDMESPSAAVSITSFN